MKTHLRRWAAAYILLTLFLASWVGQLFTQMHVFRDEAREHGSKPQWDQFWFEFWKDTFENWQSEFLQLLAAALLVNAFQKYLFQADYGADKGDVKAIMKAIEEK